MRFELDGGQVQKYPHLKMSTYLTITISIILAFNASLNCVVGGTTPEALLSKLLFIFEFAFSVIMIKYVMLLCYVVLHFVLRTARYHIFNISCGEVTETLTFSSSISYRRVCAKRTESIGRRMVCGC